MEGIKVRQWGITESLQVKENKSIDLLGITTIPKDEKGREKVEKSTSRQAFRRGVISDVPSDTGL